MSTGASNVPLPPQVPQFDPSPGLSSASNITGGLGNFNIGGQFAGQGSQAIQNLINNPYGPQFQNDANAFSQSGMGNANQGLQNASNIGSMTSPFLSGAGSYLGGGEQALGQIGQGLNTASSLSNSVNPLLSGAGSSLYGIPGAAQGLAMMGQAGQTTVGTGGNIVNTAAAGVPGAVNNLSSTGNQGAGIAGAAAGGIPGAVGNVSGTGAQGAGIAGAAAGGIPGAVGNVNASGQEGANLLGAANPLIGAGTGMLNAGQPNLQAGQGLLNYLNPLMQQAFDPQQGLYNQLYNQTQQQSLGNLENSGLAQTPWGQGVLGQNLNNFNNQWQQYLLNNMVQGTQGAGNLMSAANTGAGTYGNLAQTGAGIAGTGAGIAGTGGGLATGAANTLGGLYGTGAGGAQGGLGALTSTYGTGASGAQGGASGVGNLASTGASIQGQGGNLVGGAAGGLGNLTTGLGGLAGQLGSEGAGIIGNYANSLPGTAQGLAGTGAGLGVTGQGLGQQSASAGMGFAGGPFGTYNQIQSNPLNAIQMGNQVGQGMAQIPQQQISDYLNVSGGALNEDQYNLQQSQLALAQQQQQFAQNMAIGNSIGQGLGSLGGMALGGGMIPGTLQNSQMGAYNRYMPSGGGSSMFG